MLLPNLYQVNVNVHKLFSTHLHSLTLNSVDLCVLMEKKTLLSITSFLKLLINS